jgi:hypothetical protein
MAELDQPEPASVRPKFVILEGAAAERYAADMEFEELCARTNPTPEAREIMRAHFIPSWERGEPCP